MIAIPVSIVYFILGFISAFIFLIILAVILVKKEKKREADMFKAILQSLPNSDKDDEE